ncbi:hypothetical protein [Micromonospora sp. WMMD964]|uniref:hypothetical protein n=1 Tax=Micromonospora sp. WMMD964 TaxID=3016091 RepID=UPI00249B7AD0|nr:hypothetical protein [Micromonospora sp. WMMD964]WFF03413.1 hypothetical protein O7616_11945 [Micromonospora sp. WMMD964]
MTVVTTERLILRDRTDDPADPARIYDIYSRPEITRWLAVSPGLPMTDPAQAPERLQIWRDRHAAASCWRPSCCGRQMPDRSVTA